MISEKMQGAINDQINYELYSAYIYHAMTAYFHAINLDGFANWMHVQAQEELAHAQIFFNFVNARGGRVVLQPIAGPNVEWASPLAAFQDALAHEQSVTQRINNLVNLAIEEKDHASNSFLQWFVNEQVEEEANADAIIRKLQLISEDRGGLFMIDRELAARVFVAPAILAAG